MPEPATRPPISSNIEPLSPWRLFRQPHFSPFKCYLRRDRNLGVILNPKVGSTTFREILVEGLGLLNQRPMLGPWWPINRTRRFTTAPITDFFRVFGQAEQFDLRCFVRNPYARVLSAWNDKLVRGFHAPHYPRSMRKLVPRLRRWAAHRALPGADPDRPVPFDTFVRFIASQAEGQRNQHWDTQTAVLLARHIPYRRIYPMETDFVTGMVEILGRIGLREDWVRERLERPANASRQPTRGIYTQALADRVYAIYAEDFSRFGYDRDSWIRL